MALPLPLPLILTLSPPWPKSNTAQTKPNQTEHKIGTRSPILLQDRNPLLHDLLHDRSEADLPLLLQDRNTLSGFTLSPSQSSPPICVLSRIMGWSLSDVMFVTKHNMANAVATVSKQLEHVSEALASTKRHLTKRLENLDWKLDELKETSKRIANDVSEVKSNLNQIGHDIEIINQMVSGLEGKIERLESKQDTTNSGLWYLCQLAGGMKDGLSTKPFQDVGTKLTDYSTLTYGENSLKGLQFIAESKEPSAIEELTINRNKKIDASDSPAKRVSTIKTRIHRSYPVGMSLTRDILGPYV